MKKYWYMQYLLWLWFPISLNFFKWLNSHWVLIEPCCVWRAISHMHFKWTLSLYYTGSYTDSVWAENKHYSVWKHQWSSNTSVRLTIEFTLMCGCSASCSLTALLSFSVHSPHHRLFLWSCCVWMDSGDVVLLPLWPFCSRVQTHWLPQPHRTEANVYEWPQPRINRNERLCYKYN